MPMDMFIKFDGIDGESTDDKHAKWIEVLSFTHGMSQIIGGSRSSTGAATGGRVDIQDFNFQKSTDATTPKLHLFCCNGTHIKKGVFEVCKATGDKTLFYSIVMNDLIISSVSATGARNGDGVPSESVTVNAGEYEWTYVPTDQKTGKPAGKMASKWSLVTNKGS
jgi:type VI secretion system secreted protein Hcp